MGEKDKRRAKKKSASNGLEYDNGNILAGWWKRCQAAAAASQHCANALMKISTNYSDCMLCAPLKTLQLRWHPVILVGANDVIYNDS